MGLSVITVVYVRMACLVFSIVSVVVLRALLLLGMFLCSGYSEISALGK